MASPEPDKGPFVFNYEFWVCSKCRKPSRLVFEGLTNMRVPHKATALLSLSGRADGIQELTFATPEGKKVCLVYFPYPRKVDMDQGRELLLGLWHKLDAATDAVMSDPAQTNSQTKFKRVEARAFAEVLADFMQPFFTSADEIVREAVVRYKARQAGEDHETPGLAEHIWDPTKNWDGSPRIEFNTDKPAAKKSAFKSKPKLTAEQEVFCRKALADKVMPADALADMFKVPVSTINDLG